MDKAIFAGTFDPFTVGHLDIAKRASKLVDKLLIAVADNNNSKNSVLSAKNRVELIQKVLDEEKLSIQVVSFEGLLTDFAKKNNIKYLIRGIRSYNDLLLEKNNEAIYKILNFEIECIYLLSNKDYSYITSTIVREIIKLGGEINNLVPKNIIQDVIKNYK